MSKIVGVMARTSTTPQGFHRFECDGTWYGTYKTDYSHLEGKVVEFEAEKRGNFWNAKGVKASEQAAPAAASARQSHDERQASIVLQSSYKTAADVLGHVLSNGLVQLPSKKADQFDAVLGVLDEIAIRLYNNCSDPVPFIEYFGAGVAADDPTTAEDYSATEA